MEKQFVICVSESGVPYNLIGPFSSMQNANDYLRGMAYCDAATMDEIELYNERSFGDDSRAYVVTAQLPCWYH